MESGEAAYLVGDHESGDKFLDRILEKAASALDKAKVYESKMDNNTASYKYMKAIGYGIEGLRMLGFAMPDEPTPEATMAELARGRELMKDRRIEDLIDLPELTDPERLTIARILMSLVFPTYVGFPAYMPLITMKLLNLTLTEGNSRYAPYGYSMYGTLLIGKFGDIEQGFRFGRMAMDLQDKIGVKQLRSQTIASYTLFVNHWKRPVRTDIEYFLDGYQSGFEAGGFLYAGMCITGYIRNVIFTGETLDNLLAETGKYLNAVKELHVQRYIDCYHMFYQSLHNLMGEAEDRLVLKGEIWDENQRVPQMIEANDSNNLFLYYAGCKLPLFFLYEQYEDAIKMGREGAKYLAANPGQFILSVHNFYFSMALLARYPVASREKQEEYLGLVDTHQEKMKEWASCCPENFEHKYLLVEAERCGLRRIAGRDRVPGAGRAHRAARGARLPHRRLRLHDLHRQQRAAARGPSPGASARATWWSPRCSPATATSRGASTPR